MLRSMYSGVSGLRSHQVYLDTVGNNIANVNTAGYKSSQVVFQDMLSQTMTGAGRPTEMYGGTNPYQVGLGTKIAGVTKNFTQGSAQDTGRITDMMIEGDGFFITRQIEGGGNFYTRAGSLSLDGLGRFTTPTGNILQGWNASVREESGEYFINPNTQIESITVPIGQVMKPKPTLKAKLAGNLPASAVPGQPEATVTTGTTFYDKSGAPMPVTFTWTKKTVDTWTVTATTPDNNTPPGLQELLKDAPVKFTNGLPNKTSLQLDATKAANYSFDSPHNIEIILDDKDSADKLVSYTGEATVNIRSQNGSTMGFLRSFNVAANGDINGVFSNGERRVLGRVALASFSNPDGLERIGQTSFAPTANSGEPQITSPGTGQAGSLKGGSVEMSNVDLSQEFTNMISAQRGFQANSRIITASDEILQDLVNMKR